ncbi:GT2 family glycosyltransferase [Idiomarina fontislapidosi]|uniref:Glycosyltransferase 2-like domain-containing protein n=1 Tax=Idiomarina fontislapidosi TaxID=263723 RepID=A0A432XYD5_9GAMM|nr:glycosyltransferase family 2 protein [Idiomarina fontislapidosi]PYE32830.1 GT2 family glycosyltransferase [Idiomarina fontislapidosi]RUO53730.1 hypothetical protein CWE25_07525 [Idiomarina fontislapidosi]
MERRIKIKSTIKFEVKSKRWKLKLTSGVAKLVAIAPQKLGWQRVTVSAKTPEALKKLQGEISFYLRQNDNIASVALIKESPRKLALVFYRHNPLSHLILEWQDESPGLSNQKALFAIKHRAITATKAWFFMLQSVAKRKSNTGEKHSQIYRITRARQKRQGTSHALKKLVQEYQPLLTHQLITCEPYQHWRLYTEPKLAIDQPQSNQVRVNSFAHLDDICESDWYTPLGDEVTNARQFNRAFNETVTIHPQAAVIYWDHDYLADGRRVQPQFKPSWDADYFMSYDYIDLAFAVKGSVIKQLIRHNEALKRRPHLLLLNLLVGGHIRSSSQTIVNISAVLQHLPATQSIWLNATQTQARQALVKQWYQQQGLGDVTVESGYSVGVTKASFKLIKQPKISIIIPTRDALAVTRTCVESVLNKTNYTNFEVIIVDNQSREADTLAWFDEITKDERVRVLAYNAPFNYSAINNFAVAHASGDWVCLLNNDTEVINTGWLTEMAQYALREDVGCVGAKLYYHDNTIQHAGVVMGLWGLAGHSHKFFLRHAPGYMNRLVAVQKYSAVTAACLLVNKKIYQRVNGLNEQDLTVAFNDVDFCLKVQALGYINIWTPYAELYHYESKSRGKDDTPEKQAREAREIEYMRTTWSAEIKNDPCYNVNLTRDNEDFNIRLSFDK